MKSLLVIGVFLLASTLPAGPAELATLPDPSTGVIDGHDATLVWPARYRDYQSHELLSVEGCEAHFVPSTNLDAESTRPCGKWFVPEAGKYKIWLQGKDFISPQPLVLNYAPAAPTGRGRAMVAPVVPLGFVALSNETHVSVGENLRFLALKVHYFDDWLRTFDRRVADARRPTAMPIGTALAGIFDQRNGDAIALSRPLVIAPNQTTIAKPAPPERDSDVLVVLQKPLAPKRETLRIALNDKNPDVLLHASDAVFAVWYGVAGSSATLAVEADALTLPPVTLRLVPKKVTTFRGALTKKPNLKVSVLAPNDVFEKMRVSVDRVDERESLRTVDVVPGPNEIHALPPQQLRVTLTADQWSFVQDVDLTDGSDSEIIFLLEPIAIRGTVYRAKEPARASIAFGYDLRDIVKVETDEDGRYEAVFWQRSAYVAKVKLTDDSSAPFIDPFVEIEQTRTLNFHLPANRIVARVFNAKTGLPIESATVGVSTEAKHDVVGEMSLSHRYTADDKGVLVLPPLRPGRAHIEVSAPGFVPSEPQVIDVDATTERELSFPLEATKTTAVRVVLPGGVPAAGAEAIVLPDLISGRVIWRGSAAPDGEIAIGSRGANEIVIVRHPNASSRVMPIGNIAETIQLAPADPTPIVLRSTNTSGDPVRFALLTVWIDGLRLTNSPAAFATWSQVSMTNGDGLWNGRNLPAEPVRLLATRNVTPEQLAAGAYDNLAQTIAYPRSQTIAIRVVE